MNTKEILQGIKDWAAPKVIYDISAAHNNTKYTDLSDALGTNGGNIPQEYRKGGITVRFVQSSDNKYVQYFLTKNEWSSSEADWEKMNLEEDVSQLGQEVNNDFRDVGVVLSNIDSSISKNGRPLLTELTTFVRGTIYQGVYNPDVQYRVVSNMLYVFKSFKVFAAPGFRINVIYYDMSGTEYEGATDWNYAGNPLDVPVGKNIRIVISKYPEDTTIVADIDEFIAALLTSYVDNSYIVSTINSMKSTGYINVNYKGYPTKFGIPQGVVGGEPTIVKSSNWQFAKIPIKKGQTIISYEYYSALGIDAIIVNSENEVVYSSRVLNDGIREISITEDGLYYLYTFKVVPLGLEFVRLYVTENMYKEPLGYVPLKYPIQIHEDGSINLSTVMDTYRIECNGARLVKFYTRLLSSPPVMAINIYDGSGNRLISTGKMTTTSTDKYLLSQIPENAKYIYLTSRKGFDAKIYFDNANNADSAFVEAISDKYNRGGLNSYFGEKPNLGGFDIEKYGEDVMNDHASDSGNTLYGQGCAIYGRYYFRFFIGGFCQIFDFSELDKIRKINEFYLGSAYHENHANSCSFGIDINMNTGFPYLYVSEVGSLSGLTRVRCNVESINLNGSTLTQTIDLELTNQPENANFLVGNDGYLYAYWQTINDNVRTFHFYKFNLPDISESIVVLTDADIIDSWEDIDTYSTDNAALQGGMVFNDRLFLLVGLSNTTRYVNIYNTDTHKLATHITLTDIISNELEDCVAFNGMLAVATNGGTGINMIRFR